MKEQRFSVFRFSDIEVREREFTVSRADHVLAVEPKAFRVLLFLLRNPQKLISKDELLDAVWNDTSVSENSLTRCVTVLRRVLGDDTREPRYIATVPRVGYRFLCEVHVTEDSSGLLADSPAHQPPGVAESNQVPLDLPPFAAQPLATARPHPRRRRLALGVGACLCLALLAFAILRHKQRSQSAATLSALQSIAILPFENLSGDPSQEYFADGMTDELITMLARNSSLKLTSRTSVMQYKRVHRPLPDIARELGVDAVLEGSVNRAADRIHINLQLIRAATDSHLWAQSYDRDTTDVAAFPMQAAQQIARVTHSSTPNTQQQVAVLPAAHDAYLRGRYLWFGNKNQMAGDEFRKAIELQPDYSLAWSGLSLNYGASALKGIADPAMSLAPAEFAAHKAVSLDDSSAEAHLALGGSMFAYRRDTASALQEIARAIELDPKLAEAYHLRGLILSAMGRHQEAVEAQRTSAELDPFARPWALPKTLLYAGRYDDALAEAKRRLESSPTDPRLWEQAYFASLAKGRKPEAIQDLEKEIEYQNDPAALESLRHVDAHGDFAAVVRWQIDRLKQRQATQYVSTMRFALLHAELRERNETLDLLEKADRQRSPDALWIQSDPVYNFLHGERRYKTVLQHIVTGPAPAK